MEDKEYDPPKSKAPEDLNEIAVSGDGNCFFRSLSMCLEYNEDNHLYYRNLIYEFIKKNKDDLKNFFPILDNESEENYLKRYNTFIESIKIDGNFAGDYEISAASIALDKEIIIYRKGYTGLELINNFTFNNNNNQEKIYLIYKNNNHFNPLINKNINLHENKYEKEKKIHQKKIRKFFDSRIKNNISFDIKKMASSNLFFGRYISYNKKSLEDYYNEVYSYLKYNVIPQRLKSEFMVYKEKNKHLDEKQLFNFFNNPYIKKNSRDVEDRKKEKRKNFKKSIKDLYYIKNERLCYRYKRAGKIYEKKIPFISELYNILYDAHINDIHNSLKVSKQNLLNSEYYFHGCTILLKNFIDNCPVCAATKNLKMVNVPEKPIIRNGPHDEYQMDIWYIPMEIRNFIPYNFVMDIIDHFSKWI